MVSSEQESGDSDKELERLKKEKNRKKNRKWYLKNKEKAKENGRRWYKNNKERARQASKQWREKNKDKRKSYKLRNKYNLSIDDVNRMHSEQHGMCLVCECELSDKHHIDHCHDSGSVRGLLCRQCNLLLGFAEKRTQTKEKAVQILKNAIELILHNHNNGTNRNEVPNL